MQTDPQMRPLAADEIEAVSGGMLYQPLIVVAIATQTAIRAGVQAVVETITGSPK